MVDRANSVVMPVPAPGGTGSSKITATVDPFVVASVYEVLDTKDGFPTPRLFYQRIYDSNLVQYVYYTKGSVDPAPAPTDTTPNHTGNLVAATHEIIEDRLA